MDLAGGPDRDESSALTGGLKLRHELHRNDVTSAVSDANAGARPVLVARLAATSMASIGEITTCRWSHDRLFEALDMPAQRLLRE